MRKNMNTENFKGYLYSHKLKLQTVKKEDSPNFGKEFINGSIFLAIDDEALVVVENTFTYEVPLYNSGKTNRNFAILKGIIEGKYLTFEEVGTDATMLGLSPSIALNEFYPDEKTLVCQKINQGGFISVLDKLPEEMKDRNSFKVDMLITKTRLVEADEEKHIDEEYMGVSGYVFDFRNNILPVELTLRNPSGIKVLDGLDISPATPLYTNIWGKVNSKTIKFETHEESAFDGEAYVNVSERKIKEYLITGMASQDKIYEFGEEGVLTKEELTKAIQDREIHLAEVKQRADDYRAQKAAQVVAGPSSFAPASATPQIPNAASQVLSGFNF